MPDLNDINQDLLLGAFAEDCLERLLPELKPVVMFRRRAACPLASAQCRSYGGRSTALPRPLLAKLLGRSPARARLTAKLLESAGMIRYEEEKLIISDRESLEGTACSCDWLARRQSQKVLEPSKVNL